MLKKRSIAAVSALVLLLTLVTPAYAVRTDSAKSFISDIRSSYAVRLEDPYGYLSGRDGAAMMLEIEHCLNLFSAGFMFELAALYDEYGSDIIIILEEPSDEDSGYALWDDDLEIVLCYDSDPEYNGITAAVLGHELGHAIHYLAEEYIGAYQSEKEFQALNGKKYPYAGENYWDMWREEEHSAAFAYNYGMSDYYEDIATIFEKLIEDPDDMSRRLGSSKNDVLRKKVEYIRDMAYEYVSDDCYAVFEPLYASVTQPSASNEPVNAVRTPSKLYVDGYPVEVQAYLIGGNNYFKLRDMAMFLDGTAGSFEVGYDAITKAVTLTTGERYTPAGGELSLDGEENVIATPTQSIVYLDYESLDLTAYTINGNNYIKLRDLCDALGVVVEYDDATKNISLFTSSLIAAA